MTKRRFRLIDSGVCDGRRQIAYDEALVELHSAGSVPDTVRFLRFPPTVLIGRHQVISSEVNVERCRAEGVGLVRRITGGGAIFLDEGQVGWELVFKRATLPLPTLADYSRAICEAVATGLSAAFGVDARHRAPTDIEVAGAKLCGTGGYFAGDTLVYQGTVLVDMDLARMARLINIPAASLAAHGAPARITTLKALLGESPTVEAVHQAILDGLRSQLEIEVESAEPSPAEAALADRRHDQEIGTDAFVVGAMPATDAGEPVLEAARQTPGGRIRCLLRLEGPPGCRVIREVLLTGDFIALPPRGMLDLEAALRGVAAADAPQALSRLTAARPFAVLSIPASDLAAVVSAAIAQDPTTEPSR